MHADTNSRWVELAEAIAEGTRITPGDRVMIALTDVEAFSATAAVVTAVFARGAYPQVQLVDERFDEAALAHASDDMLGQTPEVEAFGMEWADVYIAIRGQRPPRSTVVPAAKVARLRTAKGRISSMRWEGTRWCIVRVPTPSWADWIGESHEKLLDEFMAASVRDWDSLRGDWETMAASLEGAEEVEIRGDRTELRFSVKGRRWVVFAGERNLPDGEVSTAPITSTVHGTIYFPGPVVFAGAQIEGLQLTWDAGRLVGIEAEVGESTARELATTDAGASAIGEFGIGVNDEISTMTGDLFFDEKILGTVHIALGRAYPECGGTNQSALHWDLVKDLRPTDSSAGGTLLVDGRPVIDRGRLQTSW
jgi:aminopeptidase